jgi:hypothetical protein
LEKGKSGGRGPQDTGKFKNRTLTTQGCGTRRRDKKKDPPLLETTPQKMGRSGRAGHFEARGKQAPLLQGKIGESAGACADVSRWPPLVAFYCLSYTCTVLIGLPSEPVPFEVTVLVFPSCDTTI